MCNDSHPLSSSDGTKRNNQGEGVLQLSSTVGEVWNMIRDFNDYPRYIEGVDESVIEDDKPGDCVGAVRRFRYHGVMKVSR